MVLSPKKLWESYNRSLMPLDVSTIHIAPTPFGTEKHVYFNGEATALGCTRIYARLLVPTDCAGKAVLVMLSPEQDISATDFSPLLEKGWAVLAVDYAGNGFDRMRFTIYPSALSFANYHPDKLYESVETPQKSCWYIWTTVCLRSLTYIQSEGFEKVAMLGVGIGGSHTFKSAALSSFPVCTATLFSPGFFPEHNNELSAVGLYLSGYAPLLKAPLLQLCCSNDADSSLDNISELHIQTQAANALRISTIYDEAEQPHVPGLLYISPRSSRTFTNEAKADLFYFLSDFLDKETPVPPDRIAPSVTVTPYGSDNKLYFSVKTTMQPKEITLHISHGVTDSAYRNWRMLPIEKIGEDEYLGYADVYYIDKPIFVFASVVSQDGFVYSTPVVEKIPSSLKVLPASVNKRRLIYDSDMGIDDFFAEKDEYTPVMKEGPFGIAGICGSRGLCTYKIGDVMFSGAPDSVLQLLIFSPTEQNITFSVTDETHFKTYTCTKVISPATDWTKIMLSVSDFRSADGTFDGWHTAIFLRIDADEEYLIGSLLWV